MYETILHVRLRHKGLRQFYERDDVRGINPAMTARIRQILTDLENARTPRQMDIPGYRLHPLKGSWRGFWSVQVSGNWRIVFCFKEGEAVDVDLVHYH